MAISGNFSRVYAEGTKQPVAPLPSPDAKHSGKDDKKSYFTNGPAVNGAGLPPEEGLNVKVEPLSRGIMRMIGSIFTSHNAPESAQKANAGSFVDNETSYAANAFALSQERSIAKHASAHADTSNRQIYPSQYAPDIEFAGDDRRINDSAGTGAGPMSGNAIARGNNWFVTDSATDEIHQVTGQRMPLARRIGFSEYASPALGAMYSTNDLRGVMQKTVNTPSELQPLNTGPYDSGLPGNTVLKPKMTFPALGRLPSSMSDAMMANDPDTPAQTDDAMTGGIW